MRALSVRFITNGPQGPPPGGGHSGGNPGTTLVEAYREAGRPRQRVLANLHGDSGTLTALAKLAAQRDTLRKERDWRTLQAAEANRFYEILTRDTLRGQRYTLSEREEINRLLKQRKRILKRLATIDRNRAVIQRTGKKHCSASQEQIQAAIQNYRRELRDAEALVLGLEYMGKEQLKEAKAAFRRKSI